MSLLYPFKACGLTIWVISVDDACMICVLCSGNYPARVTSSVGSSYPTVIGHHEPKFWFFSWSFWSLLSFAYQAISWRVRAWTWQAFGLARHTTHRRPCLQIKGPWLRTPTLYLAKSAQKIVKNLLTIFEIVTWSLKPAPFCGKWHRRRTYMPGICFFWIAATIIDNRIEESRL